MGAGILISIPNSDHIPFKNKKVFILHCIVYLYDYVVCTNIIFR